jgi:hypothetical protein
MPRRDGFPTNEELLATFSENGRNIFVAALAPQIENGVPDVLKGKLLGDLVLHIGHSVEPIEGIARPVTYETLEIRTMNTRDAESIDYHLRWKGTKTADSIAAEALYFSDVRFGDTLNVEDLSTWGVHTSYEARMANTFQTRHVSTMKEKPAKMSLYAGIHLEEGAQTYAESPEFAMTPFGQWSIGMVLGSENAANDMLFSHIWRMPFHPGMIFNGSESEQYLVHCLNEANAAYSRRSERLNRLATGGAPELMLTREQGLVDQAKTSLDSAREALEKKRKR